jgi:hypothetical protein
MAGRLLATGMATVVALSAVGLSGAAQAATSVPGAPGCPMFPADNVWNTNIASLPVNADNSEWMTSLDASSTFLHPDFGPSGDPSNPYGIPFTVVPPGHPFVSIAFQYADESDSGPYPFGSDTPIEGGQDATGDRHAIMVDPSTCTLYELYDAQYSPSGSTAGSGAIWNLRSDALRPAGWTSADAAGLPILPGLVDYDEVASGSMDHAIRFTAQCTENAYIWPARHEAGQPDNMCPPMGARFRLDASFRLPASQCSAICQTVVTTLQNYGLILADNGSNWYFQGTADTRWTDTEVDQLKQIPASAFEAVDESSLMVSSDSGQTATAPAGSSPPPTSAPPTTRVPPSPPTTLGHGPAPPVVATSPPVSPTPSTVAVTPGTAERGGGAPEERDSTGSAGRAALPRAAPTAGATHDGPDGLGPVGWLLLCVGVVGMGVGVPLRLGAVRRRRRAKATPTE